MKERSRHARHSTWPLGSENKARNKKQLKQQTVNKTTNDKKIKTRERWYMREKCYTVKMLYSVAGEKGQMNLMGTLERSSADVTFNLRTKVWARARQLRAKRKVLQEERRPRAKPWGRKQLALLRGELGGRKRCGERGGSVGREGGISCQQWKYIKASSRPCSRQRRDRKKSLRVPQRGRNYLITSAWMAWYYYVSVSDWAKLQPSFSWCFSYECSWPWGSASI